MPPTTTNTITTARSSQAARSRTPGGGRITGYRPGHDHQYSRRRPGRFGARPLRD